MSRSHAIHLRMTFTHICFRSAMRLSVFIMFSARCRSDGFTGLPGGCSTPSGRGSGGGLFDFSCDGDGEAELLALELDGLLEVEAAELVPKSASGCDGPGRTAA